MRVLVTGASSLLGRATVERLLDRDDDVTCFQRTSSHLDTREVLGDVRDREAVLAAAAGHEAVVHLAALVSPRPRYQDAYDVNVLGTQHATEAAQRCGRFVHVSSPSVAFADAPAVGEGTCPASYDGADAYVATKAIAERHVLARSLVPTVVIRPHLVWGPGDTQLVDRIVQRAKAGRLRLPDHGRALIDTTYVDDAAASLVAALDRAEHGSEAQGRAWVVTGNDPRPLAELVGGILRCAGITTPPPSITAPLAARAGRVLDLVWRGPEPPLTYFSARQLSLAHWFDQREVQAALRWSPVISVREGLERLARWYAEGSAEAARSSSS
jgi:nucleoside-diphosphate-sugar epimerase